MTTANGTSQCGVSSLVVTNATAVKLGNINNNGITTIVYGPQVQVPNLQTASPSLNTAVLIESTSGLLVTGSLHTCPGNTACVDQVYGNDAHGAVGGPPFLTITAALAAAGAAGTSTQPSSVWIFPGIYSEPPPLTIPSNVNVRGLMQASVLISADNPATGQTTTMITMNSNTNLSDVSIQLTSVFHSTLQAINMLDASNSAITSVTISINNAGANATGTSTVTGILVNGPGQPIRKFYNLVNVDIVINSTGLGNKRALLVGLTSATTTVFQVIDSTFYIAGNTSGASNIAVETTTNTTTVRMYTSSCRGLTADISQTAGTLALTATFLAFSNANGLSFTDMTQPAKILWSNSGNFPTSVSRYLQPGTGVSSTTETTPYFITQTCVVLGLSAVSAVAPTNPATFSIHLNTIPVMTLILPAGATQARNSANSVTFPANSILTLLVTSGAGTSMNNLVVTVDLY